ncbi:ATP-dependent RNA helicase HrpA [Rothia sp. P6271]|uniref:ATP-dependent RNA helicase HrpA n=1 Tax=Rothia sp. P6271 TaxID=3402659 RepID=UPI003AC9897B
MSEKKTSHQSPSLSALAATIHHAPTRMSSSSTQESHKNVHRSSRGTSKSGAPKNTRRSRRSSSQGAKQPPKPRRVIAPESITYPADLPVCTQRQEIIDAIRSHQVVIVAGETGSGKTTQLPKICLEMGLAEYGMVGHTQPRRIAARSVAERIAEELGEELGHTVGYQVRFTSQVSDTSAIKLMTDGILLAEIHHDKLLTKYSVIIIDEAHERSLNIDFILGYLKQILPKRPDLKVIITSATIDPERFSRHFCAEELSADDELPPHAPPIIEVSGRTYPVEIRYRPLSEEAEHPDEDSEDLATEDRDPIDGILDGIVELSREGNGDILIFFAGEREIRDAQEAIEQLIRNTPQLPRYEVLPLYARLSLTEQNRIFRTGSKPRIVLATNVAETSLTVPGITYVIDTGTARISRYSARTKVQRLPIERISQASARQRSGRSGRTSAGIAIRLYSEEDFLSRPEFTDPEILRTNLAAVILNMSAMGVVQSIGDIERFPFVQKPENRAINDGVALLRELGALSMKHSHSRRRGSSPLTAIGRAMSKLPLDPRLSRMIVEAQKRGCAKEMMVLAAALTIQDPRERPYEQRAQADTFHRRFVDDNSDFSSFLLLWQYLHEQQEELSSSQFRKLCHREHINFLRVREWQDLFAQLRDIAQEAKIKVSAGRIIEPAAHEENLHKSVLSGLLSHIGLKDERTRGEYRGVRGTRFHIFPASSLFSKKPEWVVGAELVETSKLWARTNAKISPEWVEEVGSHLVKRQYDDPHWSAAAGAVLAHEKVTLLGLPIIADRKVQYSRIDPELCREIFIRSALVEGDWKTRHRFFKRNQRALADIEELETRLRRRDLRVDDQALFDFYNQRIPAHVVSARHFDRWWKEERTRNEHLLDFSTDHLIDHEAADYDESQFPRTWTVTTGGGELHLDLRYEYAPHPVDTASSAHTDGIAVQIPLLFLNQLTQEPFQWLIPGLREELVTALIRSLPKQIRKNFVPAPDVARQVIKLLDEEFSPIEDVFDQSVARCLKQLRSVPVQPEDFDQQKIPEHLRFTFQVRNHQNLIVGEGKDLLALQSSLHEQVRNALAQSLGASVEDISALTALGKTAHTVAQSSVPKPSSQKKAGAESQGDSTASDSSVRERSGLLHWPEEDFPRTITRTIATQQVTGYPALTDQHKSVGLQIFSQEVEACSSQRQAVTRLLSLELPSVVRYVSDHLSHQEKLIFTQNPHGSVDQLVQDCLAAAIDYLTPENPPWTKAEYQILYDRVRADLIDTVFEVTKLVADILRESTAVQKMLKKATSLSVIHAVSDMKSQQENLVYPGFVAQTGYQHLAHIPRYLQGISRRLEKLGSQLHRDHQQMLIVQELEDAYDEAVKSLPAGTHVTQELKDVGWMTEELRISFFAQNLGTAYTVSEKRIKKALREALEKSSRN